MEDIGKDTHSKECRKFVIVVREVSFLALPLSLANMVIHITPNQLLPLLVVSLLMSCIAIFLFIWGGIKSYQAYTQGNQANAKYFQITATFSNLFNCVSCICVSIYFVWLRITPLTEEDFFIIHESIRLRVATTGTANVNICKYKCNIQSL